MVVRPGAPVGPQIATTRPLGGVDAAGVGPPPPGLHGAAIGVREGAGRPATGLVAGRAPGPTRRRGRGRGSRGASATTGCSVRAASNSASSTLPGTTRATPSWCSRRSDSSSPSGAIPTTCTPAARSWATDREVEAAQVARHERDRAEARRRRRDEVGQVRAAADDGDLARGLEERRDPAVPAVAERREDMRHEVPWPGTGTRVNRDCLSTAAMTSATLSRGTRSWTAIVDEAAPNRPASWVTGETLTRSRASVASR